MAIIISETNKDGLEEDYKAYMRRKILTKEYLMQDAIHRILLAARMDVDVIAESLVFEAKWNLDLLLEFKK